MAGILSTPKRLASAASPRKSRTSTFTLSLRPASSCISSRVSLQNWHSISCVNTTAFTGRASLARRSWMVLRSFSPIMLMPQYYSNLPGQAKPAAATMPHENGDNPLHLHGDTDRGLVRVQLHRLVGQGEARGIRAGPLLPYARAQRLLPAAHPGRVVARAGAAPGPGGHRRAGRADRRLLAGPAAGPRPAARKLQAHPGRLPDRLQCPGRSAAAGGVPGAQLPAPAHPAGLLAGAGPAPGVPAPRLAGIGSRGPPAGPGLLRQQGADRAAVLHPHLAAALDPGEPADQPAEARHVSGNRGAEETPGGAGAQGPPAGIGPAAGIAPRRDRPYFGRGRRPWYPPSMR